MPYIGNPPAERFTSFAYQDLTGGSGTSFTLDNAVGNPQEIEVFVNNVRQEPGVAYTVSGTALTMTGSIATTDDFYVVFQGKAIQTATHPSDRALTATDGTFTGSATVTSDLTVDTSTLKVDATNNRVGVGTASPAATQHTLSGNSLVSIQATTHSTTGYHEYRYNTSTAVGYIGNGSSLLSGANNSDFIVRSEADLVFNSNGNNERLRVLSGGGLTFNGDTAAANALDDYETGTWTPTFLATSSNPTIASTANTTGYYAKIGDMVWFGYYSGSLNITNAGSGAAQISGLPYNSMNSSYHYWVFDYKHGTAISNDSTGGFIILNSNTMQFVRKNDTNGANWVVGNPVYLMISGYYRTA